MKYHIPTICKLFTNRTYTEASVQRGIKFVVSLSFSMLDLLPIFLYCFYLFSMYAKIHRRTSLTIYYTSL